MDIAALSMAMSASQVQQAASISMLRKSMDTQKNAMQTLLSGIQSAPPTTGRLDVRA